jgi:hypothetical protein
MELLLDPLLHPDNVSYMMEFECTRMIMDHYHQTCSAAEVELG